MIEITKRKKGQATLFSLFPEDPGSGTIEVRKRLHPAPRPGRHDIDFWWTVLSYFFLHYSVKSWISRVPCLNSSCKLKVGNMTVKRFFFQKIAARLILTSVYNWKLFLHWNLVLSEYRLRIKSWEKTNHSIMIKNCVLIPDGWLLNYLLNYRVLTLYNQQNQ